MPVQLVVEILAAAFGLLGTVLLAHKGQRAGWGFAAYLASNIGWLVFSWENRHWALFAQQAGFTAASLYGIWTWIITPWIDRRFDEMVNEALRDGRSACGAGVEQ